jgi:hypothetical protein
MTDAERLAKIRTLLQVFLAPRSTGLGPYEESHSVPRLSAEQQDAYDALCSEASASTDKVPGVGREERLARMREIVRVLLNLPKAGSSPMGIDRRRPGSDEQRAAFEELRQQAGLSSAAPGVKGLREGR